MRDYELTVLVSSDEVKDIKELLTKTGAKIKSKNDPIKRQMAYEINGAREAYYAFFELELDPAKVVELDKKLKLEDEVIRYLLVKKV